MFKKLSKQDQKDRLTSVLRYLVKESEFRSQRAFADHMGVSQSYVAHILLGDRSLDFLSWYKWLNALDCTEDRFITLLNEGVGLEEDW